MFDDMIADIMKSKKFQTAIKELFIRCRKMNISLLFIIQFLFLFQKMSDEIIQIIQNIAINHSADNDYKDFVKIYRECKKEPYYFLTIDTTLPASDPLRF